MSYLVCYRDNGRMVIYYEASQEVTAEQKAQEAARAHPGTEIFLFRPVAKFGAKFTIEKSHLT